MAECRTDAPVSERLDEGISFETVSFPLPGGATTCGACRLRSDGPTFRVPSRTVTVWSFSPRRRSGAISRQSTTLTPCEVPSNVRKGLRYCAACPMGWRVSSARFEDGVELSGGQWQQLALGRGMMRTPAAPLLLLLDEPTAALDLPWVFASDDAHHQRVGAGVLDQRFRRVRTEAGIDALLHRLRHSLATFLLGRGELLQAQARLRHRRRGHDPAGVIGHPR